MPLFDEELILNFLKIFDIQPFSGNETGTVVIIPYVDCKKMLDGQRNHDFSWNKKIEDAIEMSIQRWYFSRLNNEKYLSGAYLISRVNNKRVELNHFFKMMQNMYNDEDSLATKVVIKHDYFFEELGYFYHRLFNKKELMNAFGPFIPPYAYFDVEYEEGVNKGKIFYMRKPGMALSYDSKEFNTISTKKDEFFIGMFKLNDDCHFGNEYLGEYFRNTEQASHTSWSNDPYKDFPAFTSKKPYTKIKNIINKEVEKIFNVDSQLID